MLGRQSEVSALVPLVDRAGQKPPRASGCISYLMPSFFLYVFYLFLSALARTSSTTLNNSGESGHHCSVPDPKGKTFCVLSIHITNCGVKCRLFVDTLYNVEEVFFYSKLVESLYHE